MFQDMIKGKAGEVWKVLHKITQEHPEPDYHDDVKMEQPEGERRPTRTRRGRQLAALYELCQV